MTVAHSRRNTFARGVHPHGRKWLASEEPIEVLPTPAEVRIPLLQHLGAPCEALVASKDEVELGQMIGRAEAFVSAPVHSSVGGKVVRPSMATLANGRHVPVVCIKSDEEQPMSAEALYDDAFGGDWPTDGLDKFAAEQIAAAAKEAGLVGLGGAAFPTHVKLTANPDKPISWLLVNGCECEPYLAADYRLMLEASAAIVTGALLARRATGADKVIVCVEDNKLEAIAALEEASAGTDVEVRVLRTKYPQGGEKQLIAATLGLEVPNGGLPLDVGAVVINTGTAAALARATIRNKPLTHRVVSVTGGGITQPKNILAPIGASHRDLIEYCGGLTDEANRVIAGGPMMGFTLGDLDAPITKGTSGITVLTKEEVRRAGETPCVRCGRCVEVCPMRLVPSKLGLASRAKNADLALQYHIGACMECGCCAFACPARLPLVQLIRMGKIMVR